MFEVHETMIRGLQDALEDALAKSQRRVKDLEGELKGEYKAENEKLHRAIKSWLRDEKEWHDEGKTLRAENERLKKDLKGHSGQHAVLKRLNSCQYNNIKVLQDKVDILQSRLRAIDDCAKSGFESSYNEQSEEYRRGCCLNIRMLADVNLPDPQIGSSSAKAADIIPHRIIQEQIDLAKTILDDRGGLKPCPNSKCDAPDIRSCTDPIGWKNKMCRVECGCGCSGPWRETIPDARDAWNAMPRKPRLSLGGIFEESWRNQIEADHKLAERVRELVRNQRLKIFWPLNPINETAGAWLTATSVEELEK